MPSPDRVAIAHERIAARARRIRLIRQRVVAGTLAAFVLAWGLVVFDGSMGTSSTSASNQVASTATTTSPGDTTTSGEQDTYSSEDSTSSDDSTSSSSDDSSATMTTTQS